MPCRARFFSSGPLAVLFLLLFCSVALADWDAGGDKNTLTGASAANLMGTIENLPWIPDGEDTGRYLYVVASPSCSASEEVYKRSRSFTKDVQLRWIFVSEGDELGSLAENRTPEMVKKIFETQEAPRPKNAKFAAAAAQYALRYVAWACVTGTFAKDGNLMVPVLIWGDKEKAFVSPGLDPNGLAALIKSIPTVEVKKDFVPEALARAGETIKLLPIPKGYAYSNNTGQEAPVRMLPDGASPKVGVIKIGPAAGLPLAGVTENGYIAFTLGTDKLRFYCYDPAEAQRIRTSGKK